VSGEARQRRQNQPSLGQSQGAILPHVPHQGIKPDRAAGQEHDAPLGPDDLAGQGEKLGLDRGSGRSKGLDRGPACAQGIVEQQIADLRRMAARVDEEAPHLMHRGAEERRKIDDIRTGKPPDHIGVVEHRVVGTSAADMLAGQPVMDLPPEQIPEHEPHPVAERLLPGLHRGQSALRLPKHTVRQGRSVLVSISAGGEPSVHRLPSRRWTAGNQSVWRASSSRTRV
jgi:hypothetical protein